MPLLREKPSLSHGPDLNGCDQHFPALRLMSTEGKSGPSVKVTWSQNRGGQLEGAILYRDDSMGRFAISWVIWRLFCVNLTPWTSPACPSLPLPLGPSQTTRLPLMT